MPFDQPEGIGQSDGLGPKQRKPNLVGIKLRPVMPATTATFVDDPVGVTFGFQNLAPWRKSSRRQGFRLDDTVVLHETFFRETINCI